MPEQDETHETPDQGLLENSAEDLYEHAPCGYLSTLPDGTIAKVNQTLLTWTGYRRDDLVGRRRFQDLLPAGGRIYHETHYAPLLRMQGTVREIALEVVRADGRRLPVLVNSDVKRDAAGEPLLIRTTVFDATDRREYERELLLARNRERAARERTERLARITTVLAGAVDRRQIAAAIIEELTESIAGDRAALALLDDEGRLEVVASHGWEAADPKTWLFPEADPETAATSALQSREPRFYDAAEGSAPMPVTISAASELGALAVLPLVIEGRSIGLLTLGFKAARELSEQDRAFMVASASQCAQAVARVHLHEQTTRAARRWAFLAETSSALDESQEFVRRAQRLVDVVVSRIADVGCVEMMEGGDRTTVAAAARDERLRARWLGQVAAAGSRMNAAVVNAIASGAPQLLLGPVASGSEEQRSGARSVPLSFAALPLRVRGRVLGALTLSSFEPERRFGPDDMAFLSGLADRAALALENARLYEQERTVAHTLQQSLLAGEPPPDPRFQVATKYRPAVETLEVGGDWYDTFQVAEGVIGIVVGDVVGRGIQAASAMGQLRSATRALAGARLGPARLIERLDAFVEQVKTARWATLAYAEIELDTGLTRFACAGHPPPMLAQPTEPPQLLWEGRSTPLGTLPGLPARSEAVLTLQPGARLLLYTDGLFERRHRALDEGLDRLVEEFDRRRGAPLSTLIDELTEAMLADEEGHDDVCLLCLSFGAPPPCEPRLEERIAEAAPTVPMIAATRIPRWSRSREPMPAARGSSSAIDARRLTRRVPAARAPSASPLGQLRRSRSSRSLALASSMTSKSRPRAVSRRKCSNPIGSTRSACARSCGSTGRRSSRRPTRTRRSWTSRRGDEKWTFGTTAAGQVSSAAVSAAASSMPSGSWQRWWRMSKTTRRPVRRASSTTSARPNVRSSFSITSRARARSDNSSSPARKRSAAARRPPAALPMWSTTTASGPRSIASSSDACTSSSATAAARTSGLSELSTVYWPGWVERRMSRSRASSPIAASS